MVKLKTESNHKETVIQMWIKRNIIMSHIHKTADKKQKILKRKTNMNFKTEDIALNVLF